MVLEIFLFGFVCYVLYRFVFNFVLPIARTARTMNRQFNSMQDQQRDTSTDNRPEGFNIKTGQSAQPRKTSVPKDDYLDFEEIK